MSDGICPFATLLTGADWGQNGSRTLQVRAVVVHMTEGTNSVGLGQSRHHNTPGTFNFLTGRGGELWQFYPAHVRCSHAAGANNAGPGIENEGFTGQPLTAEQVATLGKLAHWLAQTYPVPLTYRTGDPRTYVDQSGYSGFIAHRAVDYPPDHSLLHYDEITPAEWAAAIGAPPEPKPVPPEVPVSQFFLNRQCAFVDDAGNLRHAYLEFPGGVTTVATEIVVKGCVPGADVAVRDEPKGPSGEDGLGPNKRDVWLAAPLAAGGTVYAQMVPKDAVNFKWNTNTG